MVVNKIIIDKIIWDKVGCVIEFGCYMYMFGWFMIMVGDLEIWKLYLGVVFMLLV